VKKLNTIKSETIKLIKPGTDRFAVNPFIGQNLVDESEISGFETDQAGSQVRIWQRSGEKGIARSHVFRTVQHGGRRPEGVYSPKEIEPANFTTIKDRVITR
jgi:hypothetical protein